MRIGIDIDDVLTNHCEAWFGAFNKYYQKEDGEKDLTLDDAYKWDFYADWNIGKKNVLLEVLNDDFYYDNLSLRPNAKETIEAILNSENEVIIISSTYPEHQQLKKDWILKQLPMLTEDDIIFTAQKDRINVDIMIEDNLDYAKKFNCLFLLYDRPWNRNRPKYEYTDNITRVGTWKEIKEILTNMNIINIQMFDETNSIFSEATQKLIEGIKNAKTDKECAELLNPYIKLWQQQGMLIGMKQIDDAIISVVKDVAKEININTVDEKK